MTLGDYLRPLGLNLALVRQGEMRADTEGMARRSIDPNSIIGVHVAECGLPMPFRPLATHRDQAAQ